MFSLRRVVARAAAAPSLSNPVLAPKQLLRPYSIALSRYRQPVAFKPLQQRWASDEPAETRQEPAADVAEFQREESSAAQEGDGDAAAAATAESPMGGARSPPSGKSDGRAIFVANMFYETAEKAIHEQFSRFGDIEYLKLAYDRRGMSKGYGWIVYKNETSAEEAIKEMDHSMFDGRMIVVKESFTPTMPANRDGSRRMRSNDLEEQPESPPSRTLFIGNLSYEMTDVDLNELFRPVKNVVDIRVAIDRRTGRPRGFAHADFLTVEAATEAKEYLSTRQTYGRPIKIDYSKTFAHRPERKPISETAQS